MVDVKKLVSAQSLSEMRDSIKLYKAIGYSQAGSIVTVDDGYIVMMAKVVDNA